MPWKVTLREGPHVKRRRYGDLEAALEWLDCSVDELTGRVRAQPVNLRVKRFDPAQLVAARIELSGPQWLLPTVRVGIDVHGDGTAAAYTGRVRRQVIEQRRGESPTRALRRAVPGR